MAIGDTRCVGRIKYFVNMDGTSPASNNTMNTAMSCRMVLTEKINQRINCYIIFYRGASPNNF